MAQSTGPFVTLGVLTTVRMALFASFVVSITLPLNLTAHGPHLLIHGATHGGIKLLRLSKMTLETSHTRLLNLNQRLNQRNSSRRAARPANVLSVISLRWVRNVPLKWHGRKLTKEPFLPIGTGETLLVSTMSRGLATSIFLSIAVPAGLMEQPQLSLIASTFF